MSTTKIEWCDITINPVVGCSKCSRGCANCYAERFAARLAKNPTTAKKYAGAVDAQGKWTGKIGFAPDGCFADLYNARRPKRVFVGSMGDIFHENVPQSEVLTIVSAMSLMPKHTFMLLTKRPERARDMLDGALGITGFRHIWLGVTVCNQQEAHAKIPALLDTPAAKRFISVEPMLGAVDLSNYIGTIQSCSCGFIGKSREAREGEADYEDYCPYCGTIVEEIDRSGLDWVICGGETGPCARPMHPDWVRSLRDQCAAAEVPFFFKGWGEWIAVSYEEYPDWKRRDAGKGIFTNLDPERGIFWDRDGAYTPDENGVPRKIYGTDLMCRVGKRRAGRLLDGREWSEVPS